MLRLWPLIPLLVLVGCSSGPAVVPGPAPDPGATGFEARAMAEGYAEYAAFGGPNLPLTPTYKVHGKATAVVNTAPPYLTIYLEGDAWVEPTPAGNAAISQGTVVIYRAGKRTQTGWSRQGAEGATSAPSGRRAYYRSPTSYHTPVTRPQRTYTQQVRTYQRPVRYTQVSRCQPQRAPVYQSRCVPDPIWPSTSPCSTVVACRPCVGPG